jgi:predicted N-acetyltransferase YhbS
MNVSFAKAADCEQLLDFLPSVFRRENPNHCRFEELFPDIFLPTDEAMGDHAVVRDDAGNIVACIGAYPMTLRVAGCDVPIAGIGQVSTAKEWLGKGCMSALMKAQMERLRSLGVALAWLGGRHDRYAHFGFETGSLSFDYGLDAHSLAKVGRTRTVRRFSHGPMSEMAVTPGMFALRERTAPAIVVEPIERYRMRLRRGCFEVWTATPAGASEPDAWAVIAPKPHRLDEVCGSVDGILEIAAEATKRLDTFLQIALPVCDATHELAESARRFCSWMGPRCESLAVLDRDRLLEAYAPVIRPGTRLPSKELSSAELVRACFGPEPSAFPPLPFALPNLYHV